MASRPRRAVIPGSSVSAAVEHSLTLVRDLTSSTDVLNAAEWQHALGGCILYGTDTGRTVSLTFTRGIERCCHACCALSRTCAACGVRGAWQGKGYCLRFQ